MSDREDKSNEEQQPDQQQQQQQQAPAGGGLSATANHMLQHKVDTALWATRALTLIFSVAYFLPFFSSEASYQRVLMSNAATSALRLHQRVRTVSLTRQFLEQVIAEDSAHYLMFSLNFLACGPVTLVLVPVMLFALLHFASYTLLLFDVAGENNALAPRFLISLVEYQQRNILRAAAFVEIFLMPFTIINLFLGRVNLVTPIVFFQFLSLRYQSRRNPYTRSMFHELRLSAEHVAAKPFVPAAVRSLLHTVMDRIGALAPAMHPQ